MTHNIYTELSSGVSVGYLALLFKKKRKLKGPDSLQTAWTTAAVLVKVQNSNTPNQLKLNICTKVGQRLPKGG